MTHTHKGRNLKRKQKPLPSKIEIAELKDKIAYLEGVTKGTMEAWKLKHPEDFVPNANLVKYEGDGDTQLCKCGHARVEHAKNYQGYDFCYRCKCKKFKLSSKNGQRKKEDKTLSNLSSGDTKQGGFKPQDDTKLQIERSASSLADTYADTTQPLPSKKGCGKILEGVGVICGDESYSAGLILCDECSKNSLSDSKLDCSNSPRDTTQPLTDKFILDACCGSRMFWFNKQQSNTIFIDNREYDKGYIDNRPNRELKPDMIMDFRKMDFPDKSFKLVVFDPPHLIGKPDGCRMTRTYGHLVAETWQSDIKKGFEECWRVLEDYGVLIFKWNDASKKRAEILRIIGKEPLFGHPNGSKIPTHWFCFMKIPEVKHD